MTNGILDKAFGFQEQTPTKKVRFSAFQVSQVNNKILWWADQYKYWYYQYQDGFGIGLILA